MKVSFIVALYKTHKYLLPKKFSLRVHIFNCGGSWFHPDLGRIIEFHPYLPIRQLKIKHK